MKSKKRSLSKRGKAAVAAVKMGLRVVPLVPRSKKPTVKWGKSGKPFTARTARRYWERHPDHELAIVPGINVLVLDADTPEGVAALYLIESAHDLKPCLIVITKRGEHHYFRLLEGSCVRSDAPDKRDHPDRFDIKTGEALVITPPSTDKEFLEGDLSDLETSPIAPQAFIDAVYRHNGRPEPRQALPVPLITSPNSDEKHQTLTDLLAAIDPDTGYEDWVRIGMALHNESGGADWGLGLFDNWSSGGETYPGAKDIQTKWGSFAGYAGTPVTIATLYKLAQDAGADIDAIRSRALLFGLSPEDQDTAPDTHELRQYSLRGMSEAFELEQLDHVLILGRIALQGQWTVIYARPNIGKTLLVIFLLIEAIKAGHIGPDKLYYINADDNHSGLTTKLKIAEQHGFHMLAPGHKDFRGNKLAYIIQEMCRSGTALGTILVLDTLKKFTDLMSKTDSATFANILREFISKGGTAITLAHVNKRDDDSGKPVPAGTSDIPDDADCVYILDLVGDANAIRTVEFENRKSRGGVANGATYQFSIAENLHYSALLASVVELDDSGATKARNAMDPDMKLVSEIESRILVGINTKTKIITDIMSNTNYSKRQAQTVLERYTGTDPDTCRWSASKGNRGAITYTLLTLPDIEDI